MQQLWDISKRILNPSIYPRDADFHLRQGWLLRHSGTIKLPGLSVTSRGKEACRLQKEKKERDMFSLQEGLVRSCFKQITVSKEQITGKPWCSLKCTKKMKCTESERWKNTVCTCTIKPIMLKRFSQKWTLSHHLLTLMSLQNNWTFFLLWNKTGETLKKHTVLFSMQLKLTETSASKSYNYQMIKQKVCKACTVAISSKVKR